MVTAWIQRRVGEKVIEYRPLGDRAYLGSGEDALFRSRDPRVAARQCSIFREGATFRLRDLAPRAGTLVNYRYVRDAVLVPGDVIEVGGEVYSFHQLPRAGTPRSVKGKGIELGP